MDSNRLIQEVKELQNKTGCGLSECCKQNRKGKKYEDKG